MHLSLPKGYSGRSTNPSLPQSGVWNPRGCTMRCAFSPARSRPSFMSSIVFKLVSGPKRQFTPTMEAPVRRNNTYILLLIYLFVYYYFLIVGRYLRGQLSLSTSHDLQIRKLIGVNSFIFKLLSQYQAHFVKFHKQQLSCVSLYGSKLPAFTSLTAHSPGVVSCMSPSGPMHMVTATGLSDSFKTSTAHTASSTCSKY